MADQQLYPHATDHQRNSECCGHNYSRDLATESIWISGYYTERKNLREPSKLMNTKANRMDFPYRKIGILPKTWVSAKVWKIQVRITPPFSRFISLPKRDIKIMNIYQVLN